MRPIAQWNQNRDCWEMIEQPIFGPPDVYSETWPPSGMTRSGALYERPMWAPRTSGPGSSSLPAGPETEGPALMRTVSAAEAEGGMLHPDVARARGQQTRLASQMVHMVAPDQLLPTPCASPSGNTPEEHLRKKPGRAQVTDLAILMENDLLDTGGKLLLTPRATQGGSTTETAYALGARRTDEHRAQGQVVFDTAVDFGPYQPAVDRWEAATGHPAVAPTEPAGKNGTHRLSAGFCEWMMGLPPGHITDTPGVSRRDAIKMAGNGVVPQQGRAALVDMLDAFATDRGRAEAC